MRMIDGLAVACEREDFGEALQPLELETAGRFVGGPCRPSPDPSGMGQCPIIFPY